VNVLGVSGSLRADSHNTALLRCAAHHLGSDVSFEVWDGLRDIPPYDEDADAETAPPAVAAFRAALAGADAVLFSTPEYNSSIPGQLKNAVDWASRPLGENALWGKPAAVVGASAGTFGAVWAQAEMRKTLAAAGARIVDKDLPVGHAQDAFTDDGRLKDQELRERYTEMLDELVALAEQAGEPHSLAA
jgi:chromate reductase, NAD(P)H dehydrogenase (quinone)